MENLSTVLDKKQTLDSNVKLKNYSNNSNNIYITNYSYYSTTVLLDKYNNLFDNKYRGWFAKAFFKLSEAVIHNSAEIAQAGDNPQAFFTYLINHELKKHSQEIGGQRT